MIRARGPVGRALAVAGIYALAATAWILLTGDLAVRLALDKAALDRLETAKGLLFVAVTAVVLFLLARAAFGRLYRESAAAEEAASRYRMLFESNPAPMWVFDLDTLSFLEVNGAAVAKYGWTREEFLRMTIADVGLPEDIPALLDGIEGFEGGLEETGVWRHAMRDGTLLYVELASHALEYDGRRAALVLAIDVTASVSAERALRAAEAMLRSVVQAAPVAIVAFDREMNVTMWNPAAERMSGWREDEVMGGPNPLVPPGEESRAATLILRTLEGEQIFSEDITAVRRDGSTLNIALHTSAMRDADGQVVGLLGVVDDISERKALDAELEGYRRHLEELVGERTRELSSANERLIAATETKARFLANMSHELRTPLNSIIGFSGVMMEGAAGDLTDEQRLQLSMINRSGKHLLALINDILDLSKLDAGRVVPDLAPFDMRDVVCTVVDTVRAEAERKGLSLSCDAPGEPWTVLSDRVKVQQILINLASNGVKFTDSGSVSLRLSRDRSGVAVDVCDTGIGIHPSEIERVFEEFGRSSLDSEQPREGTGLGLSISRRLARILGGDVIVHSVRGEGSVFTLRLPFTPPTGLASGEDRDAVG